ncbi:MAG: hypothetical protein CM1200mP28_15040 [Deltaproteobacteria bacterium]|nr:MAG: hypothetical protein CM1200mP28_15040 [Deltaproteobacteria bacterium]
MHEIFQLLVILLPVSKNGKDESLVLRPVVSEDVMTAQFARIDWKLLDHLVESLLEFQVLKLFSTILLTNLLLLLGGNKFFFKFNI